ncbi:glycosyltransferase [Porphyromonas asaccharolytica]|uniref:glycosyltransferase n=1 Tax=Porphyromonas asaccharolytica TaxID=28123 RepID=UPI0009D694FF|nr:glycosyltransferase [Porphyromonas asaccharolytica]
MNFVNTLAIMASWGVKNIHGSYYCPASHLLYLKQMTRLFKKVYLISSVECREQNVSHLSPIELKNLTIVDLPYYTSMLQAQRHKTEFSTTIEQIAPNVDLFYCRVPDPFCWMPAQMTDKPVIMHFVGDTADATKHNIHFSWLKKQILLAGYSIEYRHILKSARKSTVYTNGSHLSEKLRKQGIKATPVVSSTITKEDLALEPLRPLSNKPLTIIYVGYLRYAKGIDTLIEVIRRLEERHFDYQFHIVGDGDMYSTLQQLIDDLKLDDHIYLHGHIDNRDKLLSLLRASDLFFFPSLSEGSPRVVIEAMSQGCPVLSTPVGSLPGCFEENKEILFFPFKDAEIATSKIIEVGENLEMLTQLRDCAYRKVSERFTMEEFIRTITTYNYEA